jgi:hypothetical protein
LIEQEKKGIATMTMPWFASDPAPQQLTAPCRKYSGRLHSPLEQAVYPPFFLTFSGFQRLPGTEMVLGITFLKASLTTG